jgi:hypothetical protein
MMRLCSIGPSLTSAFSYPVRARAAGPIRLRGGRFHEEAQ